MDRSDDWGREPVIPVIGRILDDGEVELRRPWPSTAPGSDETAQDGQSES